jgi:hypothetical protein
MPGFGGRFDGVRRCLCPSRDFPALSLSFSSLHPIQLRPQHASIVCQRSLVDRSTIRRCYAANGEKSSPQKTQHRRWKERRDRGLPDEVVKLINSHPPYSELESAPTSAIRDALREIIPIGGNSEQILAFAKYLVQTRRDGRSLLLYTAVLALSCNQDGSAALIDRVLDEMEDDQLGDTKVLYQIALRVRLAVLVGI